MLTGDQQLDELLMQFITADPLLHADDPEYATALSELRDPWLAEGMCGHASKLLIDFLADQGIEAYNSDDPQRGIGAPLHAQIARCFPERKLDIPGPDEHGYHDRTMELHGEHTATLIKRPGALFMVDFTASQYGLVGQWPLVQRQKPDGSWERLATVAPQLGYQAPAPASSQHFSKEVEL